MDNALKDEAAQSLREIVGGPDAYAGKLKQAFAVAARRTGLTVRRVRSLWNREARVWGDEIEMLRRKRNEMRAAKTGTNTHETVSRQADLLGRLQAIESELGELRDELETRKATHSGNGVGMGGQLRKE